MRLSSRDAFANDTGETWVRNGEICPRTSGASVPIPTDGLASLTFNAATNRITTNGFQYDTAGNQTQTVRVDGSLQRFQYDAANRLVKVFDGNGYTLQTVTYGATNARLVVQDGDNYRTYYAAGGITEYTETPNNPTTPQWSKSYVYLGARLLTTFTPNGAGEATQYHHPDRLGTRLITDSTSVNTQEQVALPFGTALDSESTGASKKRFTSYERSAMTGLDYAVNRTYDAQQGRFSQADPIGMRAASSVNPQSFNLYTYCGNDPVNHLDPSGLFFGRMFRWIGKIIKVVLVAVAVALAVLAIVTIPLGLGVAIGMAGNGLLAAYFAAASAAAFGLAYGPPWLKRVIAGVGQLGKSFGAYGPGGTGVFNPNGSTAASPYTFNYQDLPSCGIPGAPVPCETSEGIVRIRIAAVGPLVFVLRAILGVVVTIGRAILRGGVRTAPALPLLARYITFTVQQLQKKFKHAPDFGVTGNYNLVNASRFKDALQAHVYNPSVRVFEGAYHGASGYIHYLDVATKLNIVTDKAGSFVTGFRLSDAQLNDLLTKGHLF